MEMGERNPLISNTLSNNTIKVRRDKDLTDFQRGQIVGVRMAGFSIQKTSDLLNLAKSTISKVMTDYTQHGKTSSGKVNSGRKTRFDDEVREKLEKVLKENPDATRKELMEELNKLLKKPVAIKTFDRWIRMDKKLRRVHIKNIKEQIKKKNVGRGRKPRVKKPEESGLNSTPEVDCKPIITDDLHTEKEFVDVNNQPDVPSANEHTFTQTAPSHTAPSIQEAVSAVIKQYEHLENQSTTNTNSLPVSQSQQTNNSNIQLSNVQQTSDLKQHIRTPIDQLSNINHNQHSANTNHTSNTNHHSANNNNHLANGNLHTANANNHHSGNSSHHSTNNHHSINTNQQTIIRNQQTSSPNQQQSLNLNPHSLYLKQHPVISNPGSIINNQQMMSKYLQTLNPLHHPSSIHNQEGNAPSMPPVQGQHGLHPMYPYHRWF